MKTKVIKRDGTIVEFDRNKIKKAVSKAFAEVYPNGNKNHDWHSDTISIYVCREIADLDIETINIEDIQDLVEKNLMEMDKDVAKAYITYRYRRALARDEYKSLTQNIIVYTTNPPCPKCKVLKKKLDEIGIKYSIVDDINSLKNTGFEYFPVLQIDNNMLDFKHAIDWVKENSI